MDTVDTDPRTIHGDMEPWLASNDGLYGIRMGWFEWDIPMTWETHRRLWDALNANWKKMWESELETILNLAVNRKE